MVYFFHGRFVFSILFTFEKTQNKHNVWLIPATTIGAVAVPLNSLWKEAEMMYGLEDSGAKVLQFCGHICLSFANTYFHDLGFHW